MVVCSLKVSHPRSTSGLPSDRNILLLNVQLLELLLDLLWTEVLKRL